MGTTTVYANVDWKSNYKYCDYTGIEGLYICTKQTSKTDITFSLVDNGKELFSSQNEINQTDDINRYIIKKSIYISEKDTYEFENQLVDKTGTPLNNNKYYSMEKIDGVDNYIISFSSNKNYLGIVDANGNELTPIKYSIIDNHKDNGYIKASIVVDKDDNGLLVFKYTLLDENYQEIIPPEFDNIFIINKNLFYAIKENNQKYDYYKYENGSFSFYKTTDWLIRYQITPNNNTNFVISKHNTNSEIEEHYGIIDKELNLLVEPKYDNLTSIDSTNYIVAQYGSTKMDSSKKGVNLFNGYYGVIDKNENIIIPFEYDKIINCKNNSFVAIKNNKKYLFPEKNINPQCSEWAKNSIISGNMYNIIPEEINNNYSNKITRAEFCKLALQTFFAISYSENNSSLSQNEIIKKYMDENNIQTASPFTDANDLSITLATNLGIVSGKGNRTFAPNDTITRQEAAVMLTNLLSKAIGYNIPEKTTNFVDEQYFAEWSKHSINKIANLSGNDNVPIMSGTGNNKFSPWFSYSREQAITTMVRIYDFAKQTFQHYRFEILTKTKQKLY